MKNSLLEDECIILDDSLGILSGPVINTCPLSESGVDMQYQYGVDWF